MRRLNSLTFRQLRALQAVSESGSITQAADILNLTPPAVHTQIKTLEENFGCAMFDRSGTEGFQLTAEGNALLLAQKRSNEVLSGAIREIEALRRGMAGSVKLGVVSTGKYFAPSLVASIKKAHPDIEVILHVGNREKIIAALCNNAVDIAIMGRPPRHPPTNELILGDHPHLIILPPGHEMAGRTEVSPEEILSHTIITREVGSGTRILTTRYLDRIAPGVPYKTIEMDSNETIKQAVIAGLGISLISAHTVIEELRAGRLQAINGNDFPIMRKWYLLIPKGQKHTGASAVIKNFIVEQSGSYLPKLDQ
ncbi:MAG: LysR family transcriptional regulator [Aestuariivita sp.]|nr:LysR family transcriptional regulator [Aestuariivita sp.]